MYNMLHICMHSILHINMYVQIFHQCHFVIIHTINSGKTYKDRWKINSTAAPLSLPPIFTPVARNCKPAIICYVKWIPCLHVLSYHKRRWVREEKNGKRYKHSHCVSGAMPDLCLVKNHLIACAWMWPASVGYAGKLQFRHCHAFHDGDQWLKGKEKTGKRPSKLHMTQQIKHYRWICLLHHTTANCLFSRVPCRCCKYSSKSCFPGRRGKLMKTDDHSQTSFINS